MFRGIFSVAMIIFLTMIASPVMSQSEIVDPAELLPPSNAIDNFRMDPPDPYVFADTGLYNYMNGAAEIFMEFGIIRGVAAEYEGGGKRLVVELFKMEDPDAAYGMYTLSNYTSVIVDQQDSQFEINEPDGSGKKNLKGDNYNLINDIAVEFFKNDIYGRIAIDDEDRFHLMAFANRILAGIPKHASRPKALAELPRIDLVAGSERYAEGIIGMNQILDIGRGDIWGFNTDAQVVAGEYRLAAGLYYSMAVIIYRHVEIADDKYQRLQQTFNEMDGYSPVPFTGPTDQRTFLLKTPDDSYMGFRYSGEKIEVFYDMDSPSQFKMILDKDPNVSVRRPR